MNKYLIFITIILSLAFFSCNRKSIYMTNKELRETLERVDKIILNADTSAYTFGQNLTYDTGRVLLSSGFFSSYWNSTLDTSDVIVRYIFNWEEGEIETVTGKIIYSRHPNGIWYNLEGKPSDAKFYKVSNRVWIPVEWPKDIINIYIRPKE